MPTAPRQKPDDTFEPWELDLIRHVLMDFLAIRLPPSDVEHEDLYQECVLHWWSRRSRYEPGRGASRETFLRKVVKSKLFDIGRSWTSMKRGSGQRPISMDASMSDDDPDGSTIGETHASQERFEADLAGLLDLRQITSRLSERQRDIISGVTADVTKTELSTRLDISRETVYRELKRIQQIFRDEGLADHLE